jgi:hypothetical protein
MRKGVFGHCFAASGVTEAHEKGTLHWHFTLRAGLSPHLLRRFAHLPGVCADISRVVDSMHVSQLPPDVQAGGHLVTVVVPVCPMQFCRTAKTAQTATGPPPPLAPGRTNWSCSVMETLIGAPNSFCCRESTEKLPTKELP